MKKVFFGYFLAAAILAILAGCTPVGAAMPDTTAPTVIATIPSSGSTGVAGNASISATFSEGMDASTISVATFGVAGPDFKRISGAVTYAGTAATFVPSSTLAGNTQFTATITTGAKDLAGNAMVSNKSWTFTTTDTTAPTVISSVPPNAATGIAINGSVTATFSKAMNAGTITTTTFTLTGPSSAAVSGTVSYAGTTANFAPASNLAPSTLYTATITTGAKDLVGNAIASNVVWVFATGTTADTTPPTVISTIPSAGATSVLVAGTVSATFSEALNAGTVSGSTFTLTGPGATPVSGTVGYSGTTATFTPSATLSGSTLFTATITTGVKDLAGNALVSNDVWTFTTASIPTVNSTVPANTATGVASTGNVTATFSETMNAATITGSTFTLAGPGSTAVSGTVSYAGTTATFTPSANLANNTLFTATITTGAQNVAGNALASNKVWTFTTAPIPTVSSTSPTNGEAGVAATTNVTATFSEAMNAATITGSTFTLTGPGSTAVAGTVSYAGTTATFTPSPNLVTNTVFTATITTGAKDPAGNALAADKVWTFTTAPIPTVISTVPGYAASGVSITGNITATFNETMNAATINGSTFTLTGPGSTPVSGSVSYAGTTATFTPAANLASGVQFTATITTGAQDLVGNALASNIPWTFTTSPALGPAPIVLGMAGNYVILAESQISDIPPSVITGDVGLSPAAESLITGFTLTNVDAPIVYATDTAEVTGKIYASDMTGGSTSADLGTAVTNMGTAYTTANGTVTSTEYLGGTLPAGTTLAPGYYTWTTNVSITGNIAISGGPNDVWIFQMTGNLTVGSGVIVALSGGAQAKNVFWKVAAAPGATLGTNSQFEGIILSATQIILQNGAKLTGRALAQTAVTLDTNTVTQPSP